jgi:hypothetical protein
MTKYFSLVTVSTIGVILALTLFVTYAFTVSAYAEVRDSGTRDRTGRVAEPAPEPPSTAPSPQPTTPPSSGGITSSTSGGVNTGGNTGGTVTTGDESVEVYEVNIGPTNPQPPPGDEEGDSAPMPEPQCDRRASSDCTPVQNQERPR